MISSAYCNNCRREAYFGKDDRSVSFNLTIKAGLQNKKCGHFEEQENHWWFCSSSCLRSFLEKYPNKDEFYPSNRITYMEESLKWQCGDISHEEFLENVKEMRKA